MHHHSSELLAQEIEVYRRQKILFVLIDILFTFDLIIFISFLHLYDKHPSNSEILNFYYPLIWIILSIIYNIFGLIVTYHCCQRGLYTFAWIGTIFLLFDCVTLGIILFVPIHTKIRAASNTAVYSSRYVIFIIFWMSISSLSLISVRLAFKLSKLLIHMQHKIINT